MIYWAQLLHFYQPPTQMPSMLKRISNESYRPLLHIFREYPHAHASVNFNGVLTEMLNVCGHKDIIDGYRELAEAGQIEFTGSAMYHAILPLLPREEVRRQISLNNHTNAHFFGKSYAPKGFFPPEMCYSRAILPPIANAGYQWLILSGIACPTDWPLDMIYKVKVDDRELVVFFRDDILSNKISFQSIEAKDFVEHLQEWRGERENIYVVTAMDAETYGHHIQDWERVFLAEVYQELETQAEALKENEEIKQAKVLAEQHEALLTNGLALSQIKMVTISELLDLFPLTETVEPVASSWSTTIDDLADNNPYPLWKGQDNPIHRLQWEHLKICIDLVNKALQCADNEESRRYASIARGLLDRAEHSCQMWWASKRPMWDLNLVHMGMLDQLRTLVNAYRAINNCSIDEETKREYYYLTVAARDIRNKLEDLLFAQ